MYTHIKDPVSFVVFKSSAFIGWLWGGERRGAVRSMKKKAGRENK